MFNTRVDFQTYQIALYLKSLVIKQNIQLIVLINQKQYIWQPIFYVKAYTRYAFFILEFLVDKHRSKHNILCEPLVLYFLYPHT